MQAFRRAIDGSSQASRPSADDRQIVKIGLRASPQPNFLRDFRRHALQKLRPVREEHDRKAGGLRPQSLQKALGFRIVGGKLHVDPLIGNVVARQKIAQLIRPRRPARAQYSDSLECRAVGSLPIIEQIIQLRIEMLRGRIPRLHEKIVDVGLIDGADRSVRVGVGGEQRPLRLGKDPHCFLQKCDAVHVRHALVGKKQGHAVVAHLQLLQKGERSLGRIASYHAVFSAVLRPQVALDRPQNIGVVIHTQQNWFRHDRSQFWYKK